MVVLRSTPGGTNDTHIKGKEPDLASAQTALYEAILPLLSAHSLDVVS